MFGTLDEGDICLTGLADPDLSQKLKTELGSLLEAYTSIVQPITVRGGTMSAKFRPVLFNTKCYIFGVNGDYESASYSGCSEVYLQDTALQMI